LVTVQQAYSTDLGTPVQPFVDGVFEHGGNRVRDRKAHNERLPPKCY
jgi:hypothetical protein